MILNNILNGYVREGGKIPRRRVQFDTSTPEKANQARSRAFIHLYLAATYGVVNFEEREQTITDGSYDGGIDAYFIDSERKVIDIIQSKFRISSQNFESKVIAPEEIMAIDLDRILAGHRENKDGQGYNGHIMAFIEKLQKIPDIARYKTKVTILANVKKEQYPLVERLFSGDETNIVNFDRCYSELVLPTVRGEQHYTSSMRLQIDLSNKSGNSKLSAEIMTAHGPSEVTVVLVPTLEIAKIMLRYKNSILRYNPRSYLEFREQRTNEGIRSSIVDIATGEFAILNNGITILSDDTFVNQRVGAQGKAQVEIVNPQIINGGQTAFTLARILEDSTPEEQDAHFFGKEVILRIITLPQVDEASRKSLILSISSATNSQTAVSAVDRTASNDDNREIAELVFRRTGILYEPKRGEYSDALRMKYVEKPDIIERSLFTRLMHIACGRYALGVERKMMRNTGGVIPALADEGVVDVFSELYEIYQLVSHKHEPHNADRILNDLAFSVFVQAYRTRRTADRNGADDFLQTVIDEAKELWKDFEQWGQENAAEFFAPRVDKHTGRSVTRFSITRWKRNQRFPRDVADYVSMLEKDDQPNEIEAVA
ncbi:AIPR family protein [Rhizobium laguerreae]|uniref:AIPR family protein n=1 Tax=Rhizobium laguerreae TaxID=1076926 RepID=UPI0014420E85